VGYEDNELSSELSEGAYVTQENDERTFTLATRKPNHRIVVRLPYLSGEAFMLWFEGNKIPRIAYYMELSESTVYRLLADAKAIIKSMMLESEFDSLFGS